MDINATLIVQMVVFVVFIVFTVRLIWPPVIKALEQRRKTIADGLAAAQQGRDSLELAEIRIKEDMMKARAQASHIVEQANQRANHIIEEAKAKAREEAAHLISLAKNDIEQEYYKTREKLMKQITDLVVAGAQKVLQKEVDLASNDRLIDNLVNGS